MNRLKTVGTAALMTAAFAAPMSGQAVAAPTFLPKAATAQSDVIHVRDYRHWNGYRGYRHHRPGYRYDNGWWFPAGAFLAGALIGGAIANNGYYGGYYGNGYYGNRYYGNGYYGGYRRYYAPAQVYYPPAGSSYRAGYRDGYRDGYRARHYDGVVCTPRLQDAGRC